jgi:hypothetical protein
MPELAPPKVLYEQTTFTVWMVRYVGDTPLQHGLPSVQAAQAWVEQDRAEKAKRLECYIQQTREDPETMYPRMPVLEGWERIQWIEETVESWKRDMAPYAYYFVREHASRQIVFTSREAQDV